MCGIVLFAGPRAVERRAESLELLRHRGPDDAGVWEHGCVSMGFTRLAINGKDTEGHQPHIHGKLVSGINGEVYNHQALRRAYSLPESSSDTQVVLPLYELHGARVIDELDGFYSAVILDSTSTKAVCLRDHMGKKPLFIGQSGMELFIVSEMKCVDNVDWFKSLPRGTAEVDLLTGDVSVLAEHRPAKVDAGLLQIFEAAVQKRLPRSELPVGVFLSGGLDSSLIAAAVSRIRADAIYFTLGENGPDRKATDNVARYLGLRDVRTVSLPSVDQLPSLVRSIVKTTESYNPSIVSNGLATYLLARAAHKAGIKVVLAGEGADELFGGYHYLNRQDPWRTLRAQLIDDMQFTELRRLDMACMAHSVEPRCPFLDRVMRAYSDELEYADMYDGDQNKVELRRSFHGVLPPEVLHRRKTSLDVGSGIRREVVRYLKQHGKTERESLLDLWKETFDLDASDPYFHAYPVFDQAIEQRGETHR